MKAQSDLTGDRKSAAEMTAPRLCGVTAWIETAYKPIETMQDATLKLDKFLKEVNGKAAKGLDFLDRITKPYTDFEEHVSEVTVSPPMTATP